MNLISYIVLNWILVSLAHKHSGVPGVVGVTVAAFLFYLFMYPI